MGSCGPGVRRTPQLREPQTHLHIPPKTPAPAAAPAAAFEAPAERGLGSVTAEPSRRRSPPSVITVSPAVRPDAIEVLSPVLGPLFTCRTFTVESVCST